MAEQQINVQITASDAQLSSALQRAAASVQASMAEMGTAFREMAAESAESTAAAVESFALLGERMEGIGAAVEATLAPLLALFALIQGGEMFEGMLEKSAETAAHLEAMAQRTGMAADALSRLQYAAEMSHVSAETLDGGMTKLSRSMADAAAGNGKAAAAYTALGVSTKDAQGHLRPLNDVLLDLADQFAGMEDGPAKAALAVALFGRSGAEMIPFLNQGREKIADLERESDKLGATMTSAQKNAILPYHEASKRLDAVLTGLRNTFVAALAPALEAIDKAFVATAGGSDLLTLAGQALGGILKALATAVIVVKTGVEALGGTFLAVTDVIANSVVTIAQVFGDVVSGNFAQAALDAKAGGAAIATAWHSHMDSVIADATRAGEAIDHMWGFSAEAPPAKEKKPKKRRAPVIGAPTPDKSDPSKDHLKDLRNQWTEIEDATTDMAEQVHKTELAFWEQHRADFAEGSDESYQVMHRIAQLRKQIAADSVNDLKNFMGAWSKADADDAARAKKMEERWRSVLGTISSAITQSFAGVIQGTQTLHNAFAKLGQSLVLTMASACEQMVEHWAAHEMAKTGATTGGTAARLAAESGAALKSVAISIASAAKQIAHAAAVGAAWMFAAMAKYGIGGLIAGPVLGAVAAAGIIGLGGRYLHSASGGFDIPGGVNPLTQLHAREMVLPAALADRVRGMTSPGGGGGAGGGGTHVHLHIAAMDAQSFDGWVQQRGAAVGRTLGKLVKDGHLDARAMGRG